MGEEAEGEEEEALPAEVGGEVEEGLGGFLGDGCRQPLRGCGVDALDFAAEEKVCLLLFAGLEGYAERSGGEGAFGL